MRKLHLKVESLVVDSFVTDDLAGGPGTVRAHETGTINCEFTQGPISQCVKARSEYDTCYVNCSCTNLQVRCFQG